MPPTTPPIRRDKGSTAGVRTTLRGGSSGIAGAGTCGRPLSAGASRAAVGGATSDDFRQQRLVLQLVEETALGCRARLASA